MTVELCMTHYKGLSWRLFALFILIALATSAQAVLPMISGEVRAVDAQPIYTPPSDFSPVVLHYYLSEGATVRPGDVVLRIDPGEALAQIMQLNSQIEETKARIAMELAELAVKVVDAERALVDAEAVLRKAEIDAAIPPEHLSGLDYDRYQGERERAEREYSHKQHEFNFARAAVKRYSDDGCLEVGKLETERLFRQTEVSQAEVRAEQAGLVVHGFDSFRGIRYDEGSSAWPGNSVGEIIGSSSAMAVVAYAFEPDRVALVVGQIVDVSFDALPHRRLEGRIERISAAPDVKTEWGNGLYFTVDIALPQNHDLPLLVGMSARVRPIRSFHGTIPGSS